MKLNRDKLNSKISDATDISKPWDKDNQAWWDWYVSLADNNVKKDQIINAEPLPNVPIPSDDEVISELAGTYPLKKYQIAFFKKMVLLNSRKFSRLVLCLNLELN